MELLQRHNQLLTIGFHLNSAAVPLADILNGVTRRYHLFEFSDQQWFPQLLRDAETSYLATTCRLLPVLQRRWAERISTVLRPGEPVEILDLCSGSGGAIPAIIDELGRLGYDARATLTDLYPNPASASHPRVSWLREPVDATRVPLELAGVRTIFSGFHHFRPDAAKAILRDAYEGRRSICIFESASSATPQTVAMMAGAPFAVLALMPLSRPFRWSYMVFTYLVPVLPLIVLWDGMVSLLRMYSPAQMKEMTKDLDAPDYAWETGEIQVSSLPNIRVPFLIGRPIP